MIKENIFKLLTYIIVFTLGLLLASRCQKEKIITKIETKTEYYTDTIVKVDTINHTNYLKDVKYIHLTDSCAYYHLEFKKDSLYTLKTYGGYVDSINIDVYAKETIIKDSVVITNTITNTIEKKSPYKNTISVEYVFNKNNNVLLDYSRNFNRVTIGGKVGLNIDNKSPIIGGKIGFSL